MPGIEWKVYYQSGGTDYEIGDIQEISYSIGRRWPTDPFRAGTATIYSRNVSGWTAPKPKMGLQCQIKPTGWSTATRSGFAGTISDLSIQYGMVANQDVAQITLEGPLAAVGRLNLTNEVFIQERTDEQASQIIQLTSAGVAVELGLSTASAQTYSGNALDLLNEITLTEVGRLAEVIAVGLGGTEMAIYFLNRNSIGNGYGSIYEFSDVPADWAAGQLAYSSLEFKSAAENYFTKVTINPQGLTKQSSGTGARVLYQDSVDFSNTQALSHAQYLKANYAKQDITPYAVTFDYVSQNAAAINNFQIALENNRLFSTTLRYRSPIAGQMVLKFRGSTYYGVIEGFRVSADPENTRITYYFSPRDTNEYLRWTSPSPYNTWDDNKWGF